MSEPNKTLSGVSKRVRISCQNCRRSHVKCEEKKPCGYCISRGIDCIENPTRSKYRRRKGYKSRKKTSTEGMNRYMSEFVVGKMCASERPTLQPIEKHVKLSLPECLAISVMLELRSNDDCNT